MAGKGSFGSLWRAGASLSALTLVSRVLGLLREMTKAAFLGTSPLADAFGIAFMIPNLFRRLFAENSISVAFIPAFRALLEEDGNKAESLRRAARFVGAVFTVVSFLTALIVGIGIIAAPLIVPFFYDRTQTVTLTEMTLLTRIMFPYLLVISIAAFFQGILNTLKIFAPSGFTPILFNIIVIGGTYLLSPHTANPARAMAIGVIVGGCVQALFQLPFVLRQGWRIAPCSLRAAFANPGVRIVLARIAPTIVGMAAYQLNDLVSTALAGNAGPGIVASLQYSLRLQELMLGVFAVSIGTVILPDLSGMAQREEWGGFNDMLAHSIRIIALITIPVTFFSLVTGREIITFIYRGGGFGDRSVSLTLRVFLCHISGLFFIAANRIIAPAFYARGDTKSPTLAGVLSFVVNMLLAAFLVGPFSGGGIAASLSIASAANTVILVWFLRRNGIPGVQAIILPCLGYAAKIAAVSVVVAGGLYLSKPFLLAPFAALSPRLGSLAFLAVGSVLFALAGFALLWVTGDQYVRWRGLHAKS